MTSYESLMYVHLATVVPAFFLGLFLFPARKGTGPHKLVGKVYMVLMLVTAIITLLMPAQVGPQFMGHFGFIHLFSALVLFQIPRAYIAIRRGQVKVHQQSMVGTYIGGILIAGSFALLPGRYLHDLIWSLF